ncbi:DUF1501 domain-containing protein [soil metagenome]
MLSIETGKGLRIGGALTRRELIRVGAIGLGGLTLPGLLRLQQASGVGAPIKGKARSVILLFLSGGPAQMDMWDLKPKAPEEIRGTFRPIDTTVPGIQITEHMPRMAQVMDKCAIVRSMTHRQGNHPAAAYWMMVGAPMARPVRDSAFMSREDRPHPGSALAKVLGPTVGVPPFVMLPEAMQPNGPERSGQHAGFLGAAYDPYRINSDPNLPDYDPGAVAPPVGVSSERLVGRRGLLDVVARQSEHLGDSAAVEALNAYHNRAFDLIASPEARRAFDIEAEPDSVRDRYGRHVFGQSVLLARRMVEAGVRLVHVNWVRRDGGKGGQGYDTHRDHLQWSRDQLLPPTDAAFASLIEDLDERGLLDETLVIMLGEFGRTPRFNQNAGRDHWPHCFSLVMAGGGIKGGHVLGASDKIAAYPTADPATPADLLATLYQCLGVDPHMLIRDRLGRPFPIAEGNPLHALL